ncbi:hypothetical protein JHK87_016012 [Glycine soja]|nr:hypothetical protein JHK87_016012 [Glycine soja]
MVGFNGSDNSEGSTNDKVALCPQLKKMSYSSDKKKKCLMVTLDDSYIEKSSNSDDEQDNIYLMVDTDEKVKVKTCSESDTSSNASSNDEEDMPYDVLLQNCHVTSLQCKTYIEKFKSFVLKMLS